MSASGRHFTDVPLSRALDVYLADGPNSMPDHVLEVALESATASRQRRWRSWGLRVSATPSPAVPIALTVTGIAAAAVIAIGLFTAGELTPGVVPTPSTLQSADPSRPDDGAERTTFADAGFSVEIQPDWTASELQPGLVKITGPSQAHLTVNVGDPDGALQTCRISLLPCVDLRVTDLDEYRRAIYGELGPLESQPATVAGEEAVLLVHPGMVFPTIRHWLVIHDGRPYLIQFQAFAEDTGAEPPMAAAILNSWRFLDPDETRGSATYEYPHLGFRVTMPDRRWRQEETFETTATFTFLPVSSVSVSVGTAAGTIRTCPESAGPWEICRTVTVSNLEELTAAIEPRHAEDHGVGVPGPVSRGVALVDGEPANRIGVLAYEYPARGGEYVTYVVTMHGSQPVIVRFHTTADHPPDEWAQFLDGFQFMD